MDPIPPLQFIRDAETRKWKFKLVANNGEVVTTGDDMPTLEAARENFRDAVRLIFQARYPGPYAADGAINDAPVLDFTKPDPNPVPADPMEPQVGEPRPDGKDGFSSGSAC